MATEVPEELEVTRQKGLFIIKFNRPSKKNALTARVL
jgi:enoyl-CoA hydratase/carnithine racemase